MRREMRAGAAGQAIAVGLMLVAFSLSGLACGLLTHAVAGGLLSPLGLPTATTGQPTHVPTHSTTSVPPTATIVATIVPPAGFSLHATVSPSRVAPGELLQIIATVVAPDHITPLAGVQCLLQAPTISINGKPPPPPLFGTWPPPQISDSAGQAIWMLTAPSASPGIYGIEVIAYGRSGSYYRFVMNVTVRG